MARQRSFGGLFHDVIFFIFCSQPVHAASQPARPTHWHFSGAERMPAFAARGDGATAQTDYVGILIRLNGETESWASPSRLNRSI